jgi:SpoVK/Ycf46/Vps4 family AAA+-type ATPase
MPNDPNAPNDGRPRVFGGASLDPQVASRYGGIPGVPGIPIGQPQRHPVSVPVQTSQEQEIEALRRRVSEQKQELDELRAEVRKVRDVHGPIAVIVRKEGNRALMALGSGQYNTCSLESWPDAVEGEAMRLAKTQEGLKLAERIKIPPGGGRVITVRKVHGDILEFLDGNTPRSTRAGRFKDIEEGERFVLDALGEIAVERLPPEKAKAFGRPTGISWADIGGLEKVKRELQEAIEDPVRHKEKYALFGQGARKGALLAGPPGTGKTLLAAACATALAEVHGKGAVSSGYIYVKGPELLNAFVGNSEAAVRLLFDSARTHHEEHGYPAIIFLDEADSLLAKRGGTRTIEGMERTIVPQFLAEMDGLDASHAFVLVATNRPEMLDPALMRFKRLDRRFDVPRPTAEETREVLKVHLKKRPCDVDVLADVGMKLLFQDSLIIKNLVLAKPEERSSPFPERGEVIPLRLRDVMSGALAAGMVAEATLVALRRLKVGGEPILKMEDLQEAIGTIYEQEKMTGQDDELQKLADGRRVFKVETP